MNNDKMAIGKKTGGRNFLPGQSGNLKGRPKFSIVSILREKLEAVSEDEKQSIAGKLIDEYIERADGTAIRDMMDRYDGKPKQYVEMSNEKDAEWLEYFKSLDDKTIEETRENTDALPADAAEDTGTRGSST